MKFKLYLSILFFLSSFLMMRSVHAAEGKMALTITPPIIKNNVTPGQIWKSYIKIVNNNDQPLNVYVQMVNFDSNGETGTVSLKPMSDAEISGNELLVNNWIQIDKGPILIPADQSMELPFIVDVPEKADPGDHHIAFLIGTKPSEGKEQGSSIKISSMLGSLLLLNVSGEVNEDGRIREFASDKTIYDSGDVKFTLRFEDTGNTILQPRGEIKIYNFLGKEKGSVEVNRKTDTGNVFPKDIRKWEYAWPVPASLFDIGRYKADIILSYGTQAKQTTEQVMYFWVIKWKPLLLSVGGILLFLFLVIFLVRRYIRNAIESTQEQYGIGKTPSPSRAPSGMEDVRPVVNLRVPPEQAAVKKKKKKRRKSRALFTSTFIIIAALLISFAILAFLYFSTRQEVAKPIKELEKEDKEVVIPEESQDQMQSEAEKTEEEAKEEEAVQASSTSKGLAGEASSTPLRNAAAATSTDASSTENMN